MTITTTSVVTIPDFAMRYVSRYLGHDAICIAILGSRCDMYRDTCLPIVSVARGNNVEIMLNSVTVNLVVRDTCKINSTSTNTVPRTVPNNVRSNRHTVDRLNNTTRVSVKQECSLG